ncbi:hypothetical protein QTP86_023601 [Hemibagrus guttatus]|nr:hypothetical protein QTP86_023601 [Hemibagrus guttatus]
MRLYYNCGPSGHLSPRCPERSSSAQVGDSSLFFSLMVPVSLCFSDRCVPVPALIDSGAAVNLIDGALVEELGIPTFPCVPSLKITAIDSQPTGGGYLTCQTKLLEFQVGLFHHEHLAFYVTSSPANPMILGFPWLRRHDPQISWCSGELVRWSPTCLKECLHERVSRLCRTSCMKETIPSAHGHIPHAYANFQEVFIEEKAARLPLHQAWDCAIDLLPNASPPRRQVYPLSLPEAKDMEDYIEAALVVGHIRPSTSPAVTKWPSPTTVWELQRFLGFANFYRRFIRNYSSVAGPLTSLLRGKPKRLAWTDQARMAFQQLKDCFTTAPILRHPDPDLPFVVEVDASSSGLGAVLSQRHGKPGKLHPCAFYSRKLTAVEANYNVGNQELLSIKAALEEWRHWLEGACHPFQVLTDHTATFLTLMRTSRRGRVYPLLLPEAKDMEDYIEAALVAGHIRPSTSPAAAGFFFVGKKDGGLWPCIDYRGLNAITVRYPIPCTW